MNSDRRIATAAIAALFGTAYANNARATQQENISTSNLGPESANAKQFGAIGNGSADDTIPLQRLIDHAASSSGVAYIPSGRYRITRPLEIKSNRTDSWISGLTIKGDAPGLALSRSPNGTCILPAFENSGSAIYVSGSPSNDNSHKGQINGLLIEDIGIDGIHAKACNGISLQYLVNCVFRNLHIARCNDAIIVSRQANGRTFGYGHSLRFEHLFAVLNRGWAFRTVGNGSINALFIDPNCTENLGGGINVVGCPLTIIGGGFYGNKGPALLHRRNHHLSDSFGPVCLGTRFETNGPSYLESNDKSAQVILEHARNSSFNTCWFLGGSEGQNGIKLPEKADDECSVSIECCRFDGLDQNISQYGIITNPKLIPFGMDSCTFNRLSTALKFHGEEIDARTAKERMRVLQNSIRIGGELFTPVNGALKKLKL